MTLQQHLEVFLDTLATERGRSAATVRNYRSALIEFLRLTKLRVPSRLTNLALDTYLAKRQAELAPATLQVHRSALRSFLRYLERAGVLVPSPAVVVRPRLAPTPLSPLSLATCAQLRASLRGRSLIDRRDSAVIGLILETGLRVAEIAALNRDSVSAGVLSVAVPGRPTRKHTLSPVQLRALAAYGALRTDADPALFVRHGNNLGGLTSLRLTPRSIERFVSKRAQAAGVVEPVTPERLRATYRARQLKAPGR